MNRKYFGGLPGGLASLALLASCVVGPVLEDLTEPYLPQGTQVTLEVAVDDNNMDGEYTAELVAVRTEGVILLMMKAAGSRLVYAPWTQIERLQSIELPGFEIRAGPDRIPGSDDLEKIRPVSRFPQGLTEDLQEQLLTTYNQQAFEAIHD